MVILPILQVNELLFHKWSAIYYPMLAEKEEKTARFLNSAFKNENYSFTTY